MLPLSWKFWKKNDWAPHSWIRVPPVPPPSACEDGGTDGTGPRAWGPQSTPMAAYVSPIQYHLRIFPFCSLMLTKRLLTGGDFAVFLSSIFSWFGKLPNDVDLDGQLDLRARYRLQLHVEGRNSPDFSKPWWNVLRTRFTVITVRIVHGLNNRLFAICACPIFSKAMNF